MSRHKRVVTGPLPDWASTPTQAEVHVVVTVAEHQPHCLRSVPDELVPAAWDRPPKCDRLLKHEGRHKARRFTNGGEMVWSWRD